MTLVLKMAFLGPLHIRWQDNTAVNLTSAKAQALLCYLAMHGRAIPRTTLATLLWSDLPETDARRNLRGIILKLRQAIGNYLIITPQTLAFNRQMPHWLDTAQFEEAVAAANRSTQIAQLETALALYRGDFLADLHVRNAAMFEEWLAQERTHFREKALTAFQAAMSIHEARGSYSQGVALGRQALALDGAREEIHLLLMRLLALDGQRAAALRQYEQCQSALAGQLGMQPSPELAALAEQIRAGQLVKQETAVSPSPSPKPTPIPVPASFVVGPPIQHPRQFFGRERILKRLFGLIRQKPLQNAAIIGPRRSGKTSLLHYLRTITTTPPSQLRPGQTHQWLPNPHHYRWVFVDFQDARLGTRTGLMAHLLKEMGLPQPPNLHLDHFLDIVSDELAQPTIILLDEIGVAMERYPELDNAFWESLRSLASHQTDGNLGFVLSASQPPDQLAHHSGLGSPFFNIFGYTAVLSPLTETEAWEFIQNSPVPIPQEEATWILAQSKGWPILLQLLCREYVLAYEDGTPAGQWQQEALAQMTPFKQALENGEW
ncbi:MAG: hypothetical protein Kow0080_10990 [Candidatus Promineifilaceae bacterium]